MDVVAKRKRVAKALRLENLEPRNLMAYGVQPHHNALIAEDVSRDFQLTPYDALLVINRLNQSGVADLPADFDPSKGGALVDVSNDGRISPLDALMVINALNVGEGVGELVEFKYEFFDAAGNSLDPNPADSVSEYRASVGQTVVLRTSIKDLRPQGDAATAFSAFLDIDLKNQDGSTAEIIELQYGETNTIRIGGDVRSGSFTLQLGQDTTAPINAAFTGTGAFDRVTTATRIQTALEGLTSIGTGNVKVLSLRRVVSDQSDPFEFTVSYVGSKVRQNIPNPIVVSTTLANAASAPVLLEIEAKSPYELLKIPSTVTQGQFAIRFGSGANEQTTALITPIYGAGATLDRDATALAIRNAVAALPFVQSTSNISVTSLPIVDTRDSSNFHFSIEIAEPRDLPSFRPSAIVNSTLKNSLNADLTAVILPRAAVDPSVDSDVFKVAAKYDFSPQIPTYVQFTQGWLQNDVAGTYTLDEVGGGHLNFDPTSIPNPDAFKIIFETTFVAARAGTVLVSGNQAERSEILLINSPDAIPAGQVIYPQNVQLRVLLDIQANNFTFSVPEDSAATNRDITSNVDLIVGSSFGVIDVGTPSNGGGTTSFVSSATGKTFAFTPTPNFFGQTTFTYTVRSNLNAVSTGTVTVNVTGSNDAPQIIGTSFSVDEDTPAPALTITPAQMFNGGPNETSETVTITNVNAITNQTNGSVTISPAGNVVYTPASNFFGTALFTVTGQDNNASPLSTTATITVTVNPVNDAPVAFSGTLSTNEDIALSLASVLTSSNAGPGETGQTISMDAIASTAQGGSVTVNAGVPTYNPPANFFGTDSFVYTIRDNATPALTANGTITVNVISVNDAPDAVDDSGAARFTAVGLINQGTTLDPRRNDSAGPLETNDTIRIIAVGTPSRGGTVVITNNGTSVLYTPAAGQVTVEETFSYTIRDTDGAVGGLEDTAIATVFIVPPVLPFALDDLITVAEDSGAAPINVLSNDLFNTGATKSLLTFNQPTTGGTVARNENGTPADLTDDSLIFTPAPNVFQTVSFTYDMTDSAPGSATVTGTVFINFNEINDSPTAVDRSLTATEDEPKTFAGTTFTAGLSKGPLEDAQTLTVFSVSPVSTTGGSVSVVNGDVQYAPAPDFVGNFIFTYTVRDNGTTNGAPDPKSATATATITVGAVNDAPVPGADTASTNEDIELTIAVATLINNDRPGPATAIDEASPNQTVSFVPFSGSIASARGGSLRMSSDGLNVIYTPAADFNGSDSFTYGVSDGSLTSTGTVNVNVASVNDAPRPTRIDVVAFKNLARTYDISSQIAAIVPGPSDESSQTVRLVRVFAFTGTSSSGGDSLTLRTSGTVTLQSDGTILYRPGTDVTGFDFFGFEVIDNGSPAATAFGTIFVDIQPFIPSDISGSVWIDDNRDGVLGQFELRVGGVSVTLRGRSIGETTDIQPITHLTLADGSYQFDDMPPGTYTVSYAAPTGLIDGPDFVGSVFDTDGTDNSVRFTIEAPGGANATDVNFSVYGVEARYANMLDNLASNFYGRYPGIQQKGYYAGVSADGAPLWTLMKDGFEDAEYGEVVLSDDGTQLFLTKVDASRQVLTTTVPKNRFIKVADGSGNQFIRILAASSDLTWTAINRSTAVRKSRHFLDSVDAVFTQEGW